MTDVLLQLVGVNLNKSTVKTLKSWKNSTEVLPLWLQEFPGLSIRKQLTGVPIHLLGQTVGRPLVGLFEPPIFTPHSILFILSRRKLNFPNTNHSHLTATTRKQYLKVSSQKTLPPEVSKHLNRHISIPEAKAIPKTRTTVSGPIENLNFRPPCLKVSTNYPDYPPTPLAIFILKDRNHPVLEIARTTCLYPFRHLGPEVKVSF